MHTVHTGGLSIHNLKSHGASYIAVTMVAAVYINTAHQKLFITLFMLNTADAHFFFTKMPFNPPFNNPRWPLYHLN
jgi:hypothetical protein